MAGWIGPFDPTVLYSRYHTRWYGRDRTIPGSGTKWYRVPYFYKKILV